MTHGQVMNFVWHCLNFAILVVVLVKFLKAPIQNALKGRSEEIEKAFSDLEDKKREAESKYAEYEKKLSQMDKEAERILKNFIEQGEAEKEKIIAQAKESAERIKNWTRPKRSFKVSWQTLLFIWPRTLSGRT